MSTAEEYLTTEDGVRLFFQKVGDGPPVILPNGFHLFDDFQPLAARRTLIFYDVRNRGRSDGNGAGSILQDAGDLDAVRRYFGLDRLDLIAHSYIGVLAAVYAMKYPDRVNRVVQIGTMQPDAAKQYPPSLPAADSTLAEVFSRIAELRNELAAATPQEACEQVWRVLRRIYVTDPKDAEKIHWGRCELPQERTFMQYWTAHILPSIQQLHFPAEELAHLQATVLVVHGRRDRAAPYGGGRDWAMRFPNARLVTVENAGHAPWIEAPGLVFGSIQTFLDGEWPQAAEQVRP